MTNQKQAKEPFIRIARRNNTTLPYQLFVRLFAIGLSFLLVVLVAISVTGGSFGSVVDAMNEKAFGNKINTELTFRMMMMLLGVALALAPAFKMKFWNIGAQGQVLAGALASGVVIHYMSGGMSNGLTVFVMLIFALLAGGLWGVIPAVCKAKWGTNETLFTLMMNYLALQFVAAARNDWQGLRSGFPAFEKGIISPVFGLTAGVWFLVIPIIALFIFVYMRYTKHGYEIAVVGESVNTARYAGISTTKVTLRTMLLSGAICGLIGFLSVGTTRLIATDSIASNYGFTAIIVAWVGKFNPFSMAAIAFMVVFFEQGAKGITDNYINVNGNIGSVLVAIFLFFIIGCEFFINYRFVFNSKISGLKAKRQAKFKAKFPKAAAFCAAVKAKYYEACRKTRNFTDGIGEKIKDGIDGVFNATGAFFCRLFAKKKAVSAADTSQQAVQAGGEGAPAPQGAAEDAASEEGKNND